MAEYKLLQSGVRRTADCANIPPVVGNTDWDTYRAWLKAGGKPDPVDALPLDVPASISDRQFFQQLAVARIITQTEALSAVKVGTIPAALQVFVEAITDPAEKFSANMLLAGATIFERAHPMTEQIGAAQGMTPADIDDFFREAAAL